MYAYSKHHTGCGSVTRRHSGHWLLHQSAALGRACETDLARFRAFVGGTERTTTCTSHFHTLVMEQDSSLLVATLKSQTRAAEAAHTLLLDGDPRLMNARCHCGIVG